MRGNRIPVGAKIVLISFAVLFVLSMFGEPTEAPTDNTQQDTIQQEDQEYVYYRLEEKKAVQQDTLNQMAARRESEQALELIEKNE